MDEKRRNRRIPMTGEVEIREKGKSKILYGYVTNISLNGVGLCGSQMLFPGTVLTLSIHFFEREGVRSVDGVEGLVVWSGQKGPIIYFGVDFKEPITRKNYPDLFKFLQQASPAIGKEAPK